MKMHGVPPYYGSQVNNTTLELRIGSITFGKNANIPTYNKPVRIHCKKCSVSARLVFETRAKCQYFVTRYRDDGIPCKINSPFCDAKPVISVRQSKSIEDREIGKQFALLWKVWAEQLKILFPEDDGGGAFIVPALDARSQVLSIRIRETALENQCFLETDSCLLLLHLTCVFLLKCCRKSPLKPARPMCDGRPFASPLFCRLAGRGTITFPMVSTFCALFVSLLDSARRNILSQGGSSI